MKTTGVFYFSLLSILLTSVLFPLAADGIPTPPHSGWELGLEKAFPFHFDGAVDLRYSLPDEDSDEPFEKNELIYVAERKGKIWVFPKDMKEGDQDLNKRAVFLDLTDRIKVEGEMGLLGLAFHPDFPKDPHFYVSYVCRTGKNTPSLPGSGSASGSDSSSSSDSDPESDFEGPYEDEDGEESDLKKKKGNQIVHFISRFRVKHRREAVKSSEKVLMAIKKPAITHHGGSIFFGSTKDHLYISIGDSQRPKQAQDTWSYLGKILRIDVSKKDETNEAEPEEGSDYYSALFGTDHSDNEDEDLLRPRSRFYSIPRDNPYASGGGKPEIFALGFRNPWRCSCDLTELGGFDQIWCGDLGEDTWEEINLVKKGKNYGWPVMEGPWCWVDNICNKNEEYELPFYAYPHPGILKSEEEDQDEFNSKWPGLEKPAKLQFPFNGSAVIGGYIYRGSKVPAILKAYIFGDYKTKKLGAMFFYDGTVKHVREIVGSDELHERVVAFGEDSKQELYILTHGRTRPIYRFKAWPSDETLSP